MSARRDFLDTNVLVYAFDRSDPDRQALAAAVLKAAIDKGSGVVCVQVLKELFQVATRKLPSPLPPSEARALVRDLAATLDVRDDSVEVLRRATGLCETERISIWDAFVVASAAAAGCGRLLTEDLAHGRTLLGVRIENPFRAPPDDNECASTWPETPADTWPAPV